MLILEQIMEIKVLYKQGVNTGLKLIQIFYIRRLKIDTAL